PLSRVRLQGPQGGQPGIFCLRLGALFGILLDQMRWIGGTRPDSLLFRPGRTSALGATNAGPLKALEWFPVN
ncbi:MAG: hypothetical protein ACI4W7_06485, partial [Candidatus Spyradenecus sp.]